MNWRNIWLAWMRVAGDEGAVELTEYDIPNVPIEIPSETPTVPNWYPMMSAFWIDFLTRCPRPRRCLLQLRRNTVTGRER